MLTMSNLILKTHVYSHILVLLSLHQKILLPWAAVNAETHIGQNTENKRMICPGWIFILLLQDWESIMKEGEERL